MYERRNPARLNDHLGNYSKKKTLSTLKKDPLLRLLKVTVGLDADAVVPAAATPPAAAPAATPAATPAAAPAAPPAAPSDAAASATLGAPASATVAPTDGRTLDPVCEERVGGTCELVERDGAVLGVALERTPRAGEPTQRLVLQCVSGGVDPSKPFVLWQRTGEGPAAVVLFPSYGSADDAVAAFERLFHAKTANEWSDRLRFAVQPGKWSLVRQPGAAAMVCMDKEALKAMSLTSLKEQCRLRKVAVTGNKTELFDRLTTNLSCHFNCRHFRVERPRATDVGRLFRCSCDKGFHYECLSSEEKLRADAEVDSDEPFLCTECVERDAVFADAAFDPPTVNLEEETPAAGNSAAAGDSAADGDSAAAAAAAAAPASARSRARPLSKADQNLHLMMETLRRQSVPHGITAAPDFSPLPSSATQLLDEVEFSRPAMPPMCGLYDRELQLARSAMTDSQRRDFAGRWWDIVEARLARRIERCGPLAQNLLLSLRDNYQARGTAVAAVDEHRARVVRQRTELEELGRALKAKRSELEARMDTSADMDTSDSTPVAATDTSDASAPAATPSLPADGDDALAFPDLIILYALPGLLHLLLFGLMAVIMKMYYATIIHFIAHEVLNRKAIDEKAKHFASCNELFFILQVALLQLMADAHRQHPIFTTASPPPSDSTAYQRNFLKWHRHMHRTGDVPYRHFSGLVFGPGLLYRHVRKAISRNDPVFLYALLPFVIGLYKAKGKHVLAKQGAFAFLALLSRPPHIAAMSLAAAVKRRSDRYANGIAADALLETRIGRIKLYLGKVITFQIVRVKTALDSFFACVRESLSGIGADPDKVPKVPKTRRVLKADTDRQLIIEKLRPMHIFDPPRGVARRSLAELTGN